MNLITGHTGFIGKALMEKLDCVPVDVHNLPRAHADYFYHFGSPSSNILFNEDQSCIKDTIEDFIKVVEYCKKRHIKLVFPSSATVYANNNNYARTKSALEDIVEAYGVPYVAFRIFAGYGPGEGHKKHYASVIYQWCRDMKQGIAPIIYGDGEQSRDFVYIDDIVSFIISHKDNEGVFDIGTGRSVTFNAVVAIINDTLGTHIKPTHIPRPEQYIEETVCHNPLPTHITVRQGIAKIIESMI